MENQSMGHIQLLRTEPVGRQDPLQSQSQRCSQPKGQWSSLKLLVPTMSTGQEHCRQRPLTMPAPFMLFTISLSPIIKTRTGWQSLVIRVLQENKGYFSLRVDFRTNQIKAYMDLQNSRLMLLSASLKLFH